VKLGFISDFRKTPKLTSPFGVIAQMWLALFSGSLQESSGQGQWYIEVSQIEYVKKVLNRFGMDGAKSVNTSLGGHFRLTKDQSSKIDQEKVYMSKVPYASAIGSLMFAMVCTRSDIAHAVRVVSRYISNSRKQHWEVVKWVLKYLKGSSDTFLCFTRAGLKLQGYVKVMLIAEKVLLGLCIL
jgi:hypothetical protein